jgi:hypothetical protein
MGDARFDDLVEIYGAASSVEADRLVLLLEEEGIEAISRATTMSSFPSPAESSYLVCIRSSERERARALIEAARRDGAISEDGAFLGG